MKDKDVWVKVLPEEVPVPNLLNDVPVEGDPPCGECPDAEVCSDAYLSFECHIAQARKG